MGDYSAVGSWIGKVVMISPLLGDSFEGRLTGVDDGGVSFELLGYVGEGQAGGEPSDTSGGMHVYLPWGGLQLIVWPDEGDGDGGDVVSFLERHRGAEG